MLYLYLIFPKFEFILLDDSLIKSSSNSSSVVISGARDEEYIEELIVLEGETSDDCYKNTN